MESYEIQELRDRLGLSREKFAHKIGVSAGSIYNWENGLSKPTDLALEKLNSLKKEANAKANE